MNSIYFKIFIYVHKNPFEPQAPDHLEKLAESLLYNFHREHILLNVQNSELLLPLCLLRGLQALLHVQDPKLQCFLKVKYDLS